jgi:hypothetical protein
MEYVNWIGLTKDNLQWLASRNNSTYAATLLTNRSKKIFKVEQVILMTVELQYLNNSNNAGMITLRFQECFFHLFC